MATHAAFDVVAVAFAASVVVDAFVVVAAASTAASTARDAPPAPANVEDGPPLSPRIVDRSIWRNWN